MNSRLVVGLGNEIRGDDAAGLLTVRALRKLDPAGVDVKECTGDAASLAETIAQYPEVIVVDAVASAGPPGRVMEIRPESIGQHRRHGTHDAGLAEAIGLANVLGANPTMLVVGITGRSFELGNKPDSAVIRAAAELAVNLGETLECA